MLADLHIYLGVALAGLVSFLSPCVLPLVPPYLGYLGGTTIDQLTNEKGIEARVSRKTFRGDLLVMHVTQLSQAGPICGGLFYPEGDEDLITIRLVVRALEAASAQIS